VLLLVESVDVELSVDIDSLELDCPELEVVPVVLELDSLKFDCKVVSVVD
jgi:hypothetical protein